MRRTKCCTKVSVNDYLVPCLSMHEPSAGDTELLNTVQESDVSLDGPLSQLIIS